MGDTTLARLIDMDKRELVDEAIRLRDALLATRNLIDNDPDNLNLEVIIDTVWFSPCETLVDYIDAVLEAE